MLAIRATAWPRCQPRPEDDLWEILNGKEPKKQPPVVTLELALATDASPASRRLHGDGP